VGKRGPKPRWRKFVWTPGFAYAVGLFATDGCMYNDGRHLSFVSADMDLVKTFKQCFGLKNKIGYKTGGYNNKKCPHVQWGDVAMYQFFLSMGLTPKKSKILGPLKIPAKFFFDFLRGAIDGDGSFYSYFDPRWRSSFMFYLSLSSGSKKFIDWIRKEIEDRLGIRGHIGFHQAKNVYQIKYAKADSLKILEKMYYDPTVVCLKRKHVKIETALKKNRQLDKLRASGGT